MHDDFMTELGFLGVTARLRRFSAVLDSSIKELYEQNGIDLEPSWHLVFLFLKSEQKSTMSEIAEAFHLSQPAVTKMLSRMARKGYLEVLSDGQDGRKKIIRLSKRAKARLPRFERIWHAGQQSIREMLKANKHFMHSMEQLETEIADKSFSTRAMRYLKK